MSDLCWHFVRRVDGVPVLRDGRPVPPIGEWLVHEGEAVICERGLHASRRALDALKYFGDAGAVACLVEVEDIRNEHHDKLVCTRRMIIGQCDADEVLRSFAREQALSVAHLWDMPPVVRKHLETGREAIRAAARAAAAAAAANGMLESMLLTEMGL